MIVELYGLPGAGKTTLAKELSTLPGWEKIQLHNKGQIIFYYLIGFIFHPLLFLRGAWLLLYYQNISMFHIWNSYCFRFAKYQKAYMCRTGHVILDEGLLQYLLSIIPKETDEQLIHKQILWFFKSDFLVVLNPPLETRMSQLEQKQTQRLNTLRSLKWREEVLERNNKMIVAILGQYTNVLYVNNTQKASQIIKDAVKNNAYA